MYLTLEKNMNYRRLYIPGASYFLTLGLADRKQTLLTKNIKLLRSAFIYTKMRHPFSIDAIVILPDHLHMIMSLPEDDDSFSKRIMLIKSHFSRHIGKVD